MNEIELKIFATKIRIEIVKMIGKKGGGHIGGSLSIADLVAVLYGDIMHYIPQEPLWEGRDFLVCSKGHAGPAIYAALALRGFFPTELLNQLNIGGSMLPGHCDRLKVPGIDATTGSLGQGLSIAVGIAQGLKIQQKQQKVFGIIGDGELAEGQIWEALFFSAHYHLDNLIVFLDWNKMQIDGSNDSVLSLGNIKEKFISAGWETTLINGADVALIDATIRNAIEQTNLKPRMIILDTVKGAGIPSIENMSNNHCIAFPELLVNESLVFLENEMKKLYAEQSQCKK